jgi:hypothetical protein
MSINPATYAETVKTAQEVVPGAPTIYEGHLTNGDSYYVRYRHGLILFENETKQITAHTTLEREQDGVLSFEEFQHYVVELHEETVERWAVLRSTAAEVLRSAVEARAVKLSPAELESILSDEAKLDELVILTTRRSMTLEEALLAL